MRVPLNIEAPVEGMLEGDKLDEETIDAINRAEAQLDRGEGMEFKKFAAKMRERYSNQPRRKDHAG